MGCKIYILRQCTRDRAGGLMKAIITFIIINFLTVAVFAQSAAESDTVDSAALDTSGAPLSKEAEDNSNISTAENSTAVIDGDDSATSGEVGATVDAVSAAQEGDSKSVSSESEKTKLVAPPAKRPAAADSEKLALAKRLDPDNEDFDKSQKTLQFGTASEIVSLVDKVVKNEDVRYNDVLYDTFLASKSINVKTAILAYYQKENDACLEDWAFTVIAENEDMPQKTVLSAIEYVASVKSNSCAAPLRAILDSDNDKYFTAALRALGAVGSSEDATYIADFLSREDLSAPQRQSLMNALGALHAVDTFNTVAEIAEDTSEDTFVRCYALEAIGKMGGGDSLDILLKAYETGDPNIRQYAIKGLAALYANAADGSALDTIIFAIKDDHVKVRLEAIHSIEKLQQGLAASDSLMDNLTYRAKNDKETAVKNAALKVIAQLNTAAGNDFLIGVLKDDKAGDGARAEVAKVLLAQGVTGVSEIATLAKSAAEDNTKKGLAAALGKLLIKYALPDFSGACESYLQAKDSMTVQLGLTLYKVGKYSSCTPLVESISKGRTSNRKYAEKLLGTSGGEKAVE